MTCQPAGGCGKRTIAADPAGSRIMANAIARARRRRTMQHGKRPPGVASHGDVRRPPGVALSFLEGNLILLCQIS